MCVTPERLLPGLKRYTMETITTDREDPAGGGGGGGGRGANHVVVHTHRVVPGSATSSYAMHVARTARLPASVCARAAELLRRYERGGINNSSSNNNNNTTNNMP